MTENKFNLLQESELIDDCIEYFGTFPQGHPEMWRYFFKLFHKKNPVGVKKWIYVWSFIRYADNLLDGAKNSEEFTEIYKKGIGKLEELFKNEAAPENPREQSIWEFFGLATSEEKQLFFEITRAVKAEKPQIRSIPSEKQIKLITHFNAVKPVLLHCKLCIEPMGYPPYLVEKFGTAFGNVTRLADIYVDLAEDLEQDVIQVSKETLEKLEITHKPPFSRSEIICIGKEIQKQYTEVRKEAANALDSLSMDKFTWFCYMMVLHAFDRCLYGLRSIPDFSFFLLKNLSLSFRLFGFIVSSILVSTKERRKKRF